MIDLFRAEVHRFFSRRLFRLLGALLVGGLLTASLLVFLQSSKDPSAAVASAREEVANCKRSEALFRQENPDAPKEAFGCPTVTELTRAFDKTFRYAETMPDTTRGVSIALLLLSFAIGASFVGAEWGTGSMATWLTWEPRRGRVLVAKVGACAASVAVGTVLALALLDLLFVPIGAFRGTLDGIGDVWGTLMSVWLRAAGLAAFGSIVAMGIATIIRNTAGAVAIGVVYSGFVDQLFSAVWQGRFRGWLLTYNIARLLGFPVPPANDNTFDGASFATKTASMTRPLLLFSIYAAGLTLIAYAAFRSRDVT